MSDDAEFRNFAFRQLTLVNEVHSNLTSRELSPGFIVGGERIPFWNPQRGTCKPRQMRYLLPGET